MWVLRWLTNSLALLLISYLVKGFIISSWWTALIAALIIGLVNAFIKPILVFLTLPVSILTLGLFVLIINALLLLLVSIFVKGFIINSFAAAFWAGLMLSIIGWLTNQWWVVN